MATILPHLEQRNQDGRVRGRHLPPVASSHLPGGQLRAQPDNSQQGALRAGSCRPSGSAQSLPTTVLRAAGGSGWAMANTALTVSPPLQAAARASCEAGPCLPARMWLATAACAACTAPWCARGVVARADQVDRAKRGGWESRQSGLSSPWVLQTLNKPDSCALGHGPSHLRHAERLHLLATVVYLLL